MSITLELGFTGICTIVPRRDRKIVSVLVVDASSTKPGLDGHEMEIHEAALVNHTDGGRRYRLPRSLAVGKGTADLDSVRYSGFAPLHDIAPGHGVDRVHLADGARGITCRVDLGAGSFVGPGPGAFWTLEPLLDESRIRAGWFSWTALWRIGAATPADLSPFRDLEPLDHSAPLKLPDSGTVFLEIQNLPPGHGHGGAGHFALATQPGLADDHFRWFYELAADREGLKAKLGTAGLPIPIYQSGLVEGGAVTIMSPETHTCIGAWGEPRP